MAELLPAIERETAPNPTLSVIWMHGLGADGNDFVPIVPELGLPRAPGIRFIFPHAPMIPVTWNGGAVMRAWYDIISVDDDQRHADEAGLLASRAAIRQLIERENARGIPTSRIVLAGFSQGGAIAYTAGMTHPEMLAGIIALSTYMPSPAIMAADLSAANRDTPIFAAHGSDDTVVPMMLGERARDFLLQRQSHPEWHVYRMGHAVSIDEIHDLGAWLSARLRASTAS